MCCLVVALIAHIAQFNMFQLVETFDGKPNPIYNLDEGDKGISKWVLIFVGLAGRSPLCARCPL